MRNHETTIIMHDGYQVIEHRETLDITNAESVLSTKKQKKYTAAVHNGVSVTLIRHSIRCPYCANESRVDFYSPNGRKPTPRMSKTVIKKWITPQISLFDNQEKILSLNEVKLPDGRYICPSCNNNLKEARNFREIKFTQSKNKFEISCQFISFGELLSTTCAVRENIPFDNDMKEILTFNFRNGHTYIKLANGNGEILDIRDLTDDAALWNKGLIYSLFTKSKIIKRQLKRAFLSVYDGKLPFSIYELTPEKYILLTRFVGYRLSFYDAVPYSTDEQKIDETFRTISKKLHLAKNVPAIYKEYGLPKMKSIRKLIFTNPGLMFYAEEIKKLWEVVKNPDVLCAILTCERAYQILLDLHIYNGIFCFYADYIRVKNGTSLYRKIKDEPDIMHAYAIYYMALNDSQKRKEQIKWTGKNAFSDFEENFQYLYKPMRLGSDYSLPMHAVERKIYNCVIDGYSFIWLRNMMDYKRAGEILDNCLIHWRNVNNPVVGIYKNQKPLAAIEVCKTTILQVQLAGNRSIKNNQAILNAYKKWIERFGLECYPDGDVTFEDLIF